VIDTIQKRRAVHDKKVWEKEGKSGILQEKVGHLETWITYLCCSVRHQNDPITLVLDEMTHLYTSSVSRLDLDGWRETPEK
jgi:hypothetical protein